jgi:hypothetical protein
LKDPKVKKRITADVEKKVKAIIDGLKETHEKFVDPDFGPNDKVIKIFERLC